MNYFEIFHVESGGDNFAVVSPLLALEAEEAFAFELPNQSEMGRDETFYSIEKARELVGFAPEHSWRNVLDDPRR